MTATKQEPSDTMEAPSTATLRQLIAEIHNRPLWSAASNARLDDLEHALARYKQAELPRYTSTIYSSATGIALVSKADYDADRAYVAKVTVELDDIKAKLAGTRYEKVRFAAMFENAIHHLTQIHGFTHPDGFLVDGTRYVFNPPDNLVREAWEALSKAIREIPTVIDAVREKESKHD